MSPETADLTHTLAADNLQCAIPTDPAAIVIFGASGDLVKRKLIPALYDLASNACLAPRYSILGFARSPMTDDSFRSATGDAVRSLSEVGPVDPARWSDFATCMAYFQGEYHDPQAYQKLVVRLTELDRERDLGGNRLFYLSTPPELYEPVIEQLGRAGLSKPANDQSWVRIIIEKPFGRDLAPPRI